MIHVELRRREPEDIILSEKIRNTLAHEIGWAISSSYGHRYTCFKRECMNCMSTQNSGEFWPDLGL